ncbi:hypothetical protein IFM89_000753 [Coptis chinensis]|uniref:Pentatricopeptide repeat-containing protein n=1 Tax=Coptis chinensis TaxID=261450 RepID=A0A835ITS8_9MAGN|nr:hypothetical protein IFM89_000753 [Coptis chinensis]
MNTQVLVETTEETSNLEISEDSEKLCKILTAHMGDSSSLEHSLDSFGITNVSLPLVMEVLKKLSNAGALALTFFRWVEKKEGYNKHTNESYNALIEALDKIKQFNSIWDIVEEMKRKGLVTKETFGLIMRRYVWCRKTKEAIKTFKKMEKFGMKHELSDYNRLIDTLSKARHVQRV